MVLVDKDVDKLI